MAFVAAAIAANRFGFGARAGELRIIASDPRGWLLEEIEADLPIPTALAGLPTSIEILARFQAGQMAKRRGRQERDAAKGVANDIRRTMIPQYLRQVVARVETAIYTETSFRERLVHFWANHFAVSADKPITVGIAGTLENEAVRPHLTGRFADMLLAVEQHPAMITYLDNQRSIGPNSQLGRRANRFGRQDRKVGINENLAREILELHTLGVDGGYSQDDVGSFAKVLTGWSIGGGPQRFAQGKPGEFTFRASIHEAGSQNILGQRYPDSGFDQGVAVLTDLARHPATARFIATKLARHFIADEPPPAAVARIARTFTDTDGDLLATYKTLITSREAWQRPLAKYKTPNDFLLSGLRALEFVPERSELLVGMFDTLGQRPYAPGSPAGWPDTAAHWDGAESLMKRVEWSIAVGARVGRSLDPVKFAGAALGPLAEDHTMTALSRAETAGQGVSLLLASPEFQRR